MSKSKSSNTEWVHIGVLFPVMSLPLVTPSLAVKWQCWSSNSHWFQFFWLLFSTPLLFADAFSQCVFSTSQITVKISSYIAFNILPGVVCVFFFSLTSRNRVFIVYCQFSGTGVKKNCSRNLREKKICSSGRTLHTDSFGNVTIKSVNLNHSQFGAAVCACCRWQHEVKL